MRIVEYADLQCFYCGAYATQALPQLVTDHVRPGKVSMEFRNLSFIGPDSVRAGRVAAAAAEQNSFGTSSISCTSTRAARTPAM